MPNMERAVGYSGQSNAADDPRPSLTAHARKLVEMGRSVRDRVDTTRERVIHRGSSELAKAPQTASPPAPDHLVFCLEELGQLLGYCEGVLAEINGAL